jgi:hypothetical protein
LAFLMVGAVVSALLKNYRASLNLGITALKISPAQLKSAN